MTQEKLQHAKAYYRMFRPGSWVQVPRDGLLEGIAALEAAWKECDGWKECASKYLTERSMWIDEAHTLRDRMTGKDAEIAALTTERDAYKFAAEQAIGMGTAKAIMDERDQLKHRVRELEALVKELDTHKKTLIEEIESLEKEYGRG